MTPRLPCLVLALLAASSCNRATGVSIDMMSKSVGSIIEGAASELTYQSGRLDPLEEKLRELEARGQERGMDQPKAHVSALKAVRTARSSATRLGAALDRMRLELPNGSMKITKKELAEAEKSLTSRAVSYREAVNATVKLVMRAEKYTDRAERAWSKAEEAVDAENERERLEREAEEKAAKGEEEAASGNAEAASGATEPAP